MLGWSVARYPVEGAVGEGPYTYPDFHFYREAGRGSREHLSHTVIKRTFWSMKVDL